MSRVNMWKCEACNAPNSLSREMCYSCGTAKAQVTEQCDPETGPASLPETTATESSDHTKSNTTCPKCGSEVIVRPNRLLRIIYLPIIIGTVMLLDTACSLLGWKLMEGGRFIVFAPGQDYVEYIASVVMIAMVAAVGGWCVWQMVRPMRSRCKDCGEACK